MSSSNKNVGMAIDGAILFRPILKGEAKARPIYGAGCSAFAGHGRGLEMDMEKQSLRGLDDRTLGSAVLRLTWERRGSGFVPAWPDRSRLLMLTGQATLVL